MTILIVKLGALGDVLRTTPLLRAIKARWPESIVHWLVSEKCAETLSGNPFIQKIWVYSDKVLQALEAISFDLAVNLDKEEEALLAIDRVKASKKAGFGWIEPGRLGPLDANSEYAYRLGIDDELKFRINKKTYQEISFEQLGLVFEGQEYVFQMDSKDREFRSTELKKMGLDRRGGKMRVGLNTGSGNRFAGKRLSMTSYLTLIEKLSASMGASVILLGGEDERLRNEDLAKQSRVPVSVSGVHTLKRFAAVVEACDLVITGDTTAMHIAIALRVPVVVHFAATCEAEIELYGRGEKIVSDLPCAPCYLGVCPIDEKCAETMDVDAILRAAKSLVQGVKT